ncbi:MAG TPA: 50S ribosomal protein L1 [Candidatus Saccharimonadales bacterium]|nr:50S ribosomal protein L1 [Candidatus Saccharimonadales bacterium]
MGRPKIKNIDSAIDLDKVELPKEEESSVEVESNEPTKETKKTKAKAKTEKVEKKNKASERYLKLIKEVDKSKSYPIKEAVELVKKTSSTKFDSTIEAHINVQIDSSKGDQHIRTTSTLPHGNGKKVTVIVFGAKNAKAIKDAGALVGDEDTLEQIEKGKINFEKVVATPEWMPKLAKVAKVLGPKGLMPNPKSGTVSTEPEKTVSELSSGLVEIKTETSPIIHVSVGKASFKEKDLEENVESLLEAVKAAKPAELKKELIKSVYLTSTMGPSVKVDLSNPS